MSLLGTARAFFEQISGLVDEFGWQRAVVDVFETGDLDGELNKGHVLRLYRWSSLEQLLGRHPCRVITASAANFLSARNMHGTSASSRSSSKRVANPEPSTVAHTSSLFSSEPEHRRLRAPLARHRSETFPHTRAGQGCVAWAARIRFLTEARLEDAGSGLAPVTEGWFVVDVRDAEWFTSETRGAACWFANEYGDPSVELPQLGIDVTVLEPGQSGVYHAESNQEAFLVLEGECRLLVEGEERRLRPGTSSTRIPGRSTHS